MPDEQEQPEIEPKSLEEIAEAAGPYPVDAYLFLREGLDYTVKKVHGEVEKPDASRHVSGPQLCEGLREFALQQWGFLAGTVLRRWNITETLDFGKMVFILIDYHVLSKTDEDCVEDFRNVFAFDKAFDTGYRIETKV